MVGTLAVMAQLGSYVPATSAVMSLFDSVLSGMHMAHIAAVHRHAGDAPNLASHTALAQPNGPPAPAAPTAAGAAGGAGSADGSDVAGAREPNSGEAAEWRRRNVPVPARMSRSNERPRQPGGPAQHQRHWHEPPQGMPPQAASLAASSLKGEEVATARRILAVSFPQVAGTRRERESLGSSEHKTSHRNETQTGQPGADDCCCLVDSTLLTHQQIEPHRQATSEQPPQVLQRLRRNPKP